jgi:hypothetical protein
MVKRKEAEIIPGLRGAACCWMCKFSYDNGCDDVSLHCKKAEEKLKESGIDPFRIVDPGNICDWYE